LTSTVTSSSNELQSVETFLNQLEAIEPAETNWTTSSLKKFETVGI